MAKYKRINLGRKSEEASEAVVKKKINYPSFYVYNKKLPLKVSEVGKTFNVSAKIKFTGVTEESREGKESFSYDFEVREITF